VILMKQEKTAEAIAAFEKALSFEENYPASTINLAKLYISQGKTERAVGLVEALSENMYDLSAEHRSELRVIRKTLGFE
jgi:predicted Zn-dependent protease